MFSISFEYLDFFRHGSVSNGKKTTTLGCAGRHRGSDAPLAHRRPGYPLSGCFPAEPDSVSPSNLRIPPRGRPFQGKLSYA